MVEEVNDQLVRGRVGSQRVASFLSCAYIHPNSRLLLKEARGDARADEVAEGAHTPQRDIECKTRHLYYYS
ncbi:hypothetical protein [Streptosporangium sp. H16]|uniref:hypothetical protein n=1 Tax=Streptosporangium sp. H16 TaxID=3444184 RepID=UPI003F79CF85